MSFDEMLVEKEGGIAVVTLNRPERFNAFTTEMCLEFPKIIDDIKKDNGIRVMIITGAGKGFCAGSDIVSRLGGDFQNSGKEGQFENLRQTEDLTLKLGEFGKPLIAAVNGIAVGAGLSIALISDIRIASEKARFGAVWVNMGLMPDMAATYYLPRIVGTSKAMELAITGDILDAQEALRIGLASRVVPHEKLMVRAKELAAKIASGPAVAIKLIKRGLLNSLNNDLRKQLDYETFAQYYCRQTWDHQEGIEAFREKRKPEFKGI